MFIEVIWLVNGAQEGQQVELGVWGDLELCDQIFRR